MTKLHTPADIAAASAGAKEVLQAIRPDASPEAIDTVIRSAQEQYEEFFAKSDEEKVSELMERAQILTMRYMEVSGMFTAAVQALQMCVEDSSVEPARAFLEMLVPTKDALSK